MVERIRSNPIIFRYEIQTPDANGGVFLYKKALFGDFVERNVAEAQRESLARQTAFPALKPVLEGLIARDYRSIPPIVTMELVGSSRPGIDAATEQSDMDILVIVDGEVSQPLFGHMHRLVRSAARALAIPYIVDAYTRSRDFYNRLQIEVIRTP